MIGIADQFVSHGISVIPIRVDGSKAPSLTSWKSYQDRLPTKQELADWFRSAMGIGAVTGQLSGGLEILDFDYNADATFWG